MDFGYNGHDFARYIRIFGKKSEKNEKIGHFLRFLGQKCRFFYNGQSAITDKVSPQEVRYNEGAL